MNGTNLFKIALRALANNKPACFPHHAWYHHRCRFRHHDARYRSGIEAKHPATDIGDGIEHDHDPSGSRQTGWCPARPIGYADVEVLTDYEALRDETNFLSAISPNVSSSGRTSRVTTTTRHPSAVSGWSISTSVT